MSRARASVVGAAGRMGEHVREALQQSDGIDFGGALEASGHPQLGETLGAGVALTSDAKHAFAGCDVAIDFTVPAATLANLAIAADLGTGYVTGTTGFTDAQRTELAAHAERIPVLHAPNFSVAVNVLAWAHARGGAAAPRLRRRDRGASPHGEAGRAERHRIATR